MRFVVLGLVGTVGLGAAVWGGLSALNKASVEPPLPVSVSQSPTTSITQVDQPKQSNSEKPLPQVVDSAQKRTPEYMLATLDGNLTSETAYSLALDHLQGRCVEDREKLASIAYGAAKEAKKEGKNMSSLEMLNAVDKVTEPLTGTGKHKCDEFYVTAVIAITAR